MLTLTNQYLILAINNWHAPPSTTLTGHFHHLLHRRGFRVPAGGNESRQTQFPTTVSTRSAHTHIYSVGFFTTEGVPSPCSLFQFQTGPRQGFTRETSSVLPLEGRWVDRPVPTVTGTILLFTQQVVEGSLLFVGVQGISLGCGGSCGLWSRFSWLILLSAYHHLLQEPFRRNLKKKKSLEIQIQSTV